MNNRQRKKKVNHESHCKAVWGYVLSYRELKEVGREYHENTIVPNNYRNKFDNEELEELARILGIPAMTSQLQKRCPYPNRLRFKTLFFGKRRRVGGVR